MQCKHVPELIFYPVFSSETTRTSTIALSAFTFTLFLNYLTNFNFTIFGHSANMHISYNVQIYKSNTNNNCNNDHNKIYWRRWQVQNIFKLYLKLNKRKKNYTGKIKAIKPYIFWSTWTASFGKLHSQEWVCSVIVVLMAQIRLHEEGEKKGFKRMPLNIAFSLYSTASLR